MKNIYFVFIISATFCSLIFSSCTPSEKYLKTKIRSTGHDNNYVRVLIKKETGPFKISSSTGIKVVDKKSGKIIYENRNGSLTFYPEKN
jgi:hypothetical protein